MAQIRLNFLELDLSDFDFNVYRKVRLNEEEILKPEFVFSFKKDKSQEPVSYVVSSEPKEGYEKVKVNNKDYLGLTKKFLSAKLISTLDIKGIKYEYQQNRSFTDDQVEFIVEQHPEGNKVVYLAPYFLSETGKFGFLIDYKFVKNPGIKFNKSVQRLSLSLDDNFRSNKNYYSQKFHLIQLFINESYQAWSSIKLDDTLVINVSNKMRDLTSALLDKKEYLFNVNKPAYSQFQGIRNNGPYKNVDDKVYFFFIFESKLKSFANQLYLSLLGKLNPGTFSGFESMFKLQFGLDNVKHIGLENYSDEELLKAVETVRDFSEKGHKSIGIFIEDHVAEDPAETSYYYHFLKYNFIKENIPLQVVNYRVLGEKNALKWSTSNLALAIFAKVGGIPWIVKPSNNNCLILGIGSSYKIDPETKKVSKFFAYSVCLDSSGLYKSLEVLADETDYTNYIEKLQANLVSMLNSGKYSDYTSCVLHLPFKIKRREIEALSKAINQIVNMEFVVIKINLDNKFFGYGYHNTYVPYESSFIKLSKDEYLVWFEGLQYGKEVVDKRLGNPVHIQFLNLQPDKVVEERKYLQDVLNLSGANWRGFNAKSVPISIYYSQIIAKYTKAFEDLPGYDEQILSNFRPLFL